MTDRSVQLSEIFEKVKRTREGLLNFLQLMPKSADLHHHLDGSCYYEDILEFGIERDLWFDPTTRRFAPPGTSPNLIAAASLAREPEAWISFRNAFSAGAWIPGTGNGKSSFFGVFGALASVRYDEGRMLRKLLMRSAAENVFYEEIIAPVIPEHIIDALVAMLPEAWESNLYGAIQLLAGKLSEDSTASAVAAHLDNWERTADLTRLHVKPPEFRYLGYALRNDCRARFLATAAAVFAATLFEPRIVGFSMAGGEDLPSSLEDFDFHMVVLNALRDQFGPVSSALHAGELTPDDCDADTLQNRIRRSVLDGHARRVGHGISIKWEDDPESTLTALRSASAAVEICFASNEIILEVEPDDHPAMTYMQAGVPIVICTDDDAISRSSLAQEYVKAVSSLDLNYTQLKKLARFGLTHSFLPPEGRSRLVFAYDEAVEAFEIDLLNDRSCFG